MLQTEKVRAVYLLMSMKEKFVNKSLFLFHLNHFFLGESYTK